MTVARGAGRAARQMAGLGRLALAVCLLAALWLGTVKGVERASREADERRAADRSAVASGFAAAVRDWLEAGRTEVTSLSRSAGSLAGPQAQGPIEAFLSQPRTFSRGVMVLTGGTVVAASHQHQVLVGLRPKPCVRSDERGTVVDKRFEELVAAAVPGADAVVSSILDVPGDCRPGVGIAISTGPAVVLAFGDIADAAARFAAGSFMTDGSATAAALDQTSVVPAGGSRILLVTEGVALEPRVGVMSVPPRVASFAASAARGGPRRARYEAGDAEVLAALAPVRAGWSIVLEQDAAVFDIELQNRPSLIVASVLTVVFAVVFALLAFFDLRRRRAHRRAEVAKNAFFSIAGHELRTPLTVIKGFAETLSGGWKDLDDKRRRLLVDRIVPQTRRLDRLVERLLVAASIQSETHTRPEVGNVDAVQHSKRIAGHFRPEAPLHSIVVLGEPGLPQVRADARSLDQVLEHLVDNAIKYSPAGGEVFLKARASGRHVQLIVEDEGVGLPSSYRHIFDKFVRASR